MLAFLGIICLIVSSLMAFSFFQQRSRKIALITSSSVVYVDNIQLRYPTLPMKNYGIPIKIKNRSRVQIIFPKLTESGDVEYIYSWHDLSDIEIPDYTFDRKDFKFKTIQQLAPIIREHLGIEPEIKLLEQQNRKINKLADLVSTSDLYANHVETYERALLNIENTLKKADELQKVYINLIREVLIGVHVAEYEPELMQISAIALDLQYQRVKEEYQNIKDVATAYSQLLKESRHLR